MFSLNSAYLWVWVDVVCNVTSFVLSCVGHTAEVGDYDRTVHHTGYVSEFKLLPVLVSDHHASFCDP